jgi:hypothetical protein
MDEHSGTILTSLILAVCLLQKLLQFIILGAIGREMYGERWELAPAAQPQDWTYCMKVSSVAKRMNCFFVIDFIYRR